jgi:DNA-binding CsgD family transcriptional regulator
LTLRETETLHELSQGATEKASAENMGCSPDTIDFHRRNIRKKLRAATTIHALAIVLGAAVLKP